MNIPLRKTRISSPFNMALAIALPLLLLGIAMAAAITFGGPTPPPAMASINDPFKSLDYSGMPAVNTFRAADGTPLAYRMYLPKGDQAGSVTLVHGSSASSESMHPLAKALAAAGYRVFALDMRGHGRSGRKGHIDFVGQLESDLADFVQAVRPPAPSSLVGFSAGGGFVLRFAGSERQTLFGSYLFLAPFISQDAPNQRPDSGGWAHVGIPRIVALSILNGIGIAAFNGLTVTQFALGDVAKTMLTPAYDFNLATNFRPQRDYRQDIVNAARPCAIVAGVEDEAFFSDRLEPMVRDAGKAWPVDLVPGIGHIALTLDPVAIQAIVGRLQAVQRGG